MDGKTERVNQILEEMLRVYVRKNPTKWEDYLHLEELAYNNKYQTSTKMIPFTVLYGWNYRTSITWDILVEQLMLGPDSLKNLEQLVTKV